MKTPKTKTTATCANCSGGKRRPSNATSAATKRRLMKKVIIPNDSPGTQ